MQERNQIVNVASVKHLSPFRYPGGKTWLVPHVRGWLTKAPNAPTTFIEPFAGGGIVGLTVAHERLAENVVLVEKDRAVASVWQTMLSRDHSWLANEILAFQMSRESAKLRLSMPARSRREQAFQTILRNRVQRGGILAPGASFMLNGENGRGVASRWYAKTLAERIRTIYGMRGRIEFHFASAFDVIKRFITDSSAVWFIDPPYTAGGKRAGSRLYAHADIDHAKLFGLMSAAAGRVMLTYDDSPEVRTLAVLHGLEVNAIPMKNAHHDVIRELVITKEAVTSLERMRRSVATVFDEELGRRKLEIDHAEPFLFAT